MNAMESGICRTVAALVAAACLSAATAASAVMPVGPGAFGAGSMLVTFDGIPEGAPVNGLSVAGISFSYTLSNAIVTSTQGPAANNIHLPAVVSVVRPAGALTLALPGLFDIFGFGYAILNDAAVANAASVTLYSGADLVGILDFDGVPDPVFAGGFAGVRSTVPFDRVDISFDPSAQAFALDDVRFGAAIPEPSTFLLTFAGVAGLFWHVRRRIAG